MDLVLPRIAKIVSPVDFLLHGTDETCVFYSTRSYASLEMNCSCATQNFKRCFVQSPHTPSNGFYNQRRVFTEIPQKNKLYSCDWLLEIDNGSFFKDVVIPCAFRKERSAFMEFSCGIVRSLAIGQ